MKSDYNLDQRHTSRVYYRDSNIFQRFFQQIAICGRKDKSHNVSTLFSVLKPNATAAPFVDKKLRVTGDYISIRWSHNIMEEKGKQWVNEQAAQVMFSSLYEKGSAC